MNRRTRTPKHFKVDWIPEAAGRKMVHLFAALIYAYKDINGKRIDNLSMAYQPDGSTIQLTLFTDPNSSDAISNEEERENEPDPPAPHN